MWKQRLPTHTKNGTYVPSARSKVFTLFLYKYNEALRYEQFKKRHPYNMCLEAYGILARHVLYQHTDIYHSYDELTCVQNFDDNQPNKTKI